jgi:hypothetical protein
MTVIVHQYLPYAGRYLTVEECIRENAYRHEAKGLWWTDMGYDERAAGSFRKAMRNHRRADGLRFKLFQVKMWVESNKLFENVCPST